MESKNNHSALAIVTAYHQCWTSKNYAQAATYLDDSIQFEMPIHEYQNKEEFMNAVKFTGNAASAITLLAELGNEEEAVLIYDFTFAPIGPMRIAEHFKTKNGKIVHIRHIHDTYGLRNAGFGNS